MLVLTRRVDEVIRIGDDIQVEVVGIKGGKVLLGIDAPSNIPVHREEIYQVKKNAAKKTNGNTR